MDRNTLELMSMELINQIKSARERRAAISEQTKLALQWLAMDDFLARQP